VRARGPDARGCALKTKKRRNPKRSRHLRAFAGSMPYFASGSGVGQQQLPRAGAGAAAPGAALETGAAPPILVRPMGFAVVTDVITERGGRMAGEKKRSVKAFALALS
jgi:hypothetical protein